MHYVATLTPDENNPGGYGVTFVDLPGCVSVGDDLDDALRMAAEALSLHVGGMLADGDPLPSPSTPQQCREADIKEAEEDNEPLPEGTLWQYVYFKPLPDVGKPETMRLTVSLKPTIVEHIDHIADEMGLSRSGVIAVATREYAIRMRNAAVQ